MFEQKFQDLDFKSAGENLTTLNYHKFLIGQSYYPSMKNINYHGISTNISNFILNYEVQFRNGTYFSETLTNVAWKPPYYTTTWLSWGRRIVKCFGLEVTDKDVFFVRFYVKREIFPNMTRKNNGGFAVLFHYPNQFLASFKTVRRQWPKRDGNKNHYLTFNLKGMNVNVQRYKKTRRNCIANWRNYDNITLANHLRKVGCSTPDQITNDTWSTCESKEKIKAARLLLSSMNLLPCREIVSIDYDVGDSVWNKVHISNGKSWNNWICFVYRILNPHFTITRQRKDVDIQTLIGYIGGYIGIFTGFALIQIPDYLYLAFMYAKRFILNCREKTRNQTKDM